MIQFRASSVRPAAGPLLARNMWSGGPLCMAHLTAHMRRAGGKLLRPHPTRVKSTCPRSLLPSAPFGAAAADGAAPGGAADSATHTRPGAFEATGLKMSAGKVWRVKRTVVAGATKGNAPYTLRTGLCFFRDSDPCARAPGAQKMRMGRGVVKLSNDGLGRPSSAFSSIRSAAKVGVSGSYDGPHASNFLFCARAARGSLRPQSLECVRG
eukprot:gene13003-biopygen12525